MPLAYSLIGSYSTVQVLSANTILDVVYCTIQTTPSGVIASVPIDETEFAVNQSVPILEATAEAIETTMSDPHVIAGTGSQSLDQSNLLQDYVVFTVQYVPTGTTGTNITVDVQVPITLLNFSEEPRDQLHAAQVQKMIDDAYANLQSAAGG